MNKIIVKILAFSCIMGLLPLNAVFAFSDLDDDHDNYEAINYLQEAGILEGYDDNTFRPDLEVNRVEYLKIIIEGSNIDTDIDEETPFQDVNHDEWYGGYLKKAYNEGWIEGYSDGSFKPTNTINKVEALKILALAQSWDIPSESEIDEKPFNDVATDDWFAPYVSYAKDAGYLDNEGSSLSPGELMTRGEISEVIYQSYIENEDEEEIEEEEEEEEVVEEETEEEEEEEEEEIVEIDFTPEDQQMISNNFFDKIRMDSDLTNTYYTNEIFYFEGEITNGSYDKITAIFDPDDVSQDPIYIDAEIEDDEFSIPVRFNFSGNYNIGFLPGNGGSSKAFSISVLPTLPESNFTENAPDEDEFEIEFKKERTTINIDSESDFIRLITFSQGSDEVEYITRQAVSKVDAFFKDFEDFQEGEVEILIETAKISDDMPLEITSTFAKSDLLTIDATTHQFSQIDEEGIEVNPPSTLENVAAFLIPGTLLEDAAQTAYVIKPNGFVEEVELITFDSTSIYNGSTLIDAGGEFNYYYEPSGEGTYIIEINNKNGQAIINHPIYIGEQIPLLPDYFDIHEREFFEGSFDLDDLRDELLDLINDTRNEHGLSSISSSNELNELAQLHSEDMAENDFFGHINLDNQSPNDRRLELEIETSVGENIAKDVSIIFGHLGLLRSASHRKNILTSEWERVGLGIEEEDGYLYISEEFSTNPLTEEDIEDMEAELLTEINELRDDLDIEELLYKSSLENVGIYINEATIEDDESLTDDLFSEALSTYGIVGSSQAIGRSFNIWNDMLSSLLEEDEFSDSNWKSIGIDIDKDSEGIIHSVVIINNQL